MACTYEILDKSQANPRVLGVSARCPEDGPASECAEVSTTVSFDARATTTVSTQISVTYSIAKKWTVWFCEDGTAKKQLDRVVTLQPTRAEVAEGVRLCRGEGSEDPEVMIVTIVINEVEPSDGCRKVLRCSVSIAD